MLKMPGKQFMIMFATKDQVDEVNACNYYFYLNI